MADSTCLTCVSAAVYEHSDIILIGCLCSSKRLTNDHLQCFHAEEIIDITLIDRDLACSLRKVYSCDRTLSSTCTIKLFAGHFYTLLSEFQRQSFRLLSCLLMIRACIDVKFLELLVAEDTVRDHAADSLLNN